MGFKRHSHSKKGRIEAKGFMLRDAALGGAAVILFERYEQKDKSGTPDP